MHRAREGTLIHCFFLTSSFSSSLFTFLTKHLLCVFYFLDCFCAAVFQSTVLSPCPSRAFVGFFFFSFSPSPSLPALVMTTSCFSFLFWFALLSRHLAFRSCLCSLSLFTFRFPPFLIVMILFHVVFVLVLVSSSSCSCAFPHCISCLLIFFVVF